jgi:hypothetical protein
VTEWNRHEIEDKERINCRLIVPEYVLVAATKRQERGTVDWKEVVGVTPSTPDPCLMTTTCNQAKDAPHGIIAIFVNDTLMTGNKRLANAEGRMHSVYDVGQKTTVANGS